MYTLRVSEKEPTGIRDMEVMIQHAAMYNYPTTPSYNSR
jgi:hypothetical protein